mmetsp:Transcript_32884/g.85385  ORF Transcript_32884/g.85385 Transcript_32884/m.85385 type:complete len:225 (-) Transcript_32884:192-866(-)
MGTFQYGERIVVRFLGVLGVDVLRELRRRWWWGPLHKKCALVQLVQRHEIHQCLRVPRIIIVLPRGVRRVRRCRGRRGLRRRLCRPLLLLLPLLLVGVRLRRVLARLLRGGGAILVLLLARPRRGGLAISLRHGLIPVVFVGRLALAGALLARSASRLPLLGGGKQVRGLSIANQPQGRHAIRLACVALGHVAVHKENITGDLVLLTVPLGARVLQSKVDPEPE